MERNYHTVRPPMRWTHGGHFSIYNLGFVVLIILIYAGHGLPSPSPSTNSRENYILRLESVGEVDECGSQNLEITLGKGSELKFKQLTNNPTMHYFGADLSPDLAKLVFTGQRIGLDGRMVESGLYVSDLLRRPDGRPVAADEPQLLVPLGRRCYQNASPCWLDEERIVFSAPIRPMDSLSCQVLWVIEVSTGKIARVTRSSGLYEASPDYSPASQRIAFARRSLRGRPIRWDIYTCDIYGNDVRRVTTPRNSHGLIHLHPEWCPDGKSLLFTTEGLRYRIAIDGSQPAECIIKS